jgi:hypothetical protein
VVEEERNPESRPSRKFAVTSEKHSERKQQRGYLYCKRQHAGASNGTACIQTNHKTLSNQIVLDRRWRRLEAEKVRQVLFFEDTE